jgi:hypothetical protein
MTLRPNNPVQRASLEAQNHLRTSVHPIRRPKHAISTMSHQDLAQQRVGHAFRLRRYGSSQTVCRPESFPFLILNSISANPFSLNERIFLYLPLRYRKTGSDSWRVLVGILERSGSPTTRTKSPACIFRPAQSSRLCNFLVRVLRDTTFKLPYFSVSSRSAGGA